MMRTTWSLVGRSMMAVLVMSTSAAGCGGGGGGTPGDGADTAGDEAVGDVPEERAEADADGSDGGPPCTSGGECDDDNPCTRDECVGFCRWTSVADGTACDDGLFCTLPGTCSDGVCTGVEENSCDDVDECTSDRCDAALGRCRNELVPRPGEEGPPGDATCSDGVDNDCDGLLDAGDPSCFTCTAAADCDDHNECTTDTCLPSLVCSNAPVAGGVPCDDGQYCLVGETCTGGICGGGEARDCSAAGTQCNIARCDEVGDRCYAEPVADGTPCNDGLTCTAGDACVRGACVGGAPFDCSALDDACNDGECDETARACIRRPRPDGSTCDDGAFCTVGNACLGGSCTAGIARDCSGLGDVCHDGICDEVGDACRASPLPNGTPCNDGLRCTVGTVCAGGTCGGGSPVDCTALSGPCSVGRCSEAAACYGAPLPDGTSCSNGLFCTIGESCAAGTCGGGVPRSCDDGDGCTTDRCDEAAGSCHNALTPRPGAEGPPGDATCADGVDNDCDRLIDLADPDCGVCSGDPDCADGNPCTTDTCTAGRCTYAPAADGTACDDLMYCTVGDACTAGACTGWPQDCSGYSSPCAIGRCDEAGDRCYAAPLPDGTTCSDGLYCTATDQCRGGACIAGGPRNCSALTTACRVGRCDETLDACVGDPLPDGTVCDDRLYCTIGDACSGGTCAGGSRDCSAYSDQCNTGACSELGDTCYGRAVPDGTACDDGNPFTPRDGCLGGACAGSVCGDGILDGPAVGGREYCDDRNTITESCMAPPGGSCVRDCSIQQDTCGNGTLETAFGETCDDGNATSFDSCTTSCNPNDRGIGAPCTCTGTSCPMGNPTVGTIVGCDNVVVPPGARLACFRSGILAGNAGYFAAGFCSAYAHVCSPSLLCAFAGIPTTVGNYASFIGPCAAGSVVVQQTISASGVTLQTKSCQRVCTGDSDCRWNEYDSYWSECGQYVCMSSPSTPGTRVCFDPRMAMP